MIRLYSLRTLQIFDVSLQLIKHNFIKFFLISVLIIAPTQVPVWIFDATSIVQLNSSFITQRYEFIRLIFQLFSFMFSLCIISNLLSNSIGKIYYREILKNNYSSEEPRKRILFLIAVMQITLHLLFVATMIALRFLAGKYLTEDTSNQISTIGLYPIAFVWVLFTLRISFAIPITIHEGSSLSKINKRRKQLNKEHYFRLVISYVITTLLMIGLRSAIAMAFSLFLYDGYIKSTIVYSAFSSIITTLLYGFASLLFTHILTVTYFNARIQYEGFDIDIEIDQLMNKENNGKSLHSFSK